MRASLLRRGLAAAPALLLGAPRAVRCEQPRQEAEKQEPAPAKPKSKKSGEKRPNWYDLSADKPYDERILSPAGPWHREWDKDWDGRHPYPDSGVKTKGKTRHILLIRHGQYNLDDDDHGLTKLGFEQSRITGQRLAAEAAGLKKDRYGEQKIKYSMLVSSNLLRAKQTAEVIAEELHDVERRSDDILLAESTPVVPLPQGTKTYPSSILTNGPRLEAAFRKYFHRDVDHKRLADEEAKAELSSSYNPEESAAAGGSGEAKPGHEYIVVVCHMNVIRYFVSRALQLPPEAWLRMRGNNCGITEIVISPNGNVSLGCFADTGHLKIEQVTFH